MPTKPHPERSLCAINAALEVLGDRWSLLILRDMLFFGKSQFSEFQSSNENIATNILSARLAFLEKANLVRRVTQPRPGVRVEYHPTLKALDLLPVMLELVVWSAKHYQVTARAEHLVERIHTDRNQLLMELREQNLPRLGIVP